MRLAISAMLLIFITSVATGFLFYGFVTGLIGTFMSSTPKGLGLLYLEATNVNATCITAYVRNMGAVDITVTNAYVDNQPHSLTQNVHITPGSLGTVYITGTYTKGTTYGVKLVCNNGYLIAFDVTYE